MDSATVTSVTIDPREAAHFGKLAEGLVGPEGVVGDAPPAQPAAA